MPKLEFPEGYWIESLKPAHRRENFSCGVEALDTYLQRQMAQDRDRGTAAPFILTEDGTTIAGFYTLSALSILGQELPAGFGKKLPSRNPVGVTLLGRMAVSAEYRGKGLGALLLMDALYRALEGSRHVASWAVVIDAKDGAEEFYLRYGFMTFPGQQKRMFLPMKMIEKLFG